MLNQWLGGIEMERMRVRIVVSLTDLRVVLPSRRPVSSHHCLFTEWRVEQRWMWSVTQCEPAQYMHESLRKPAASGRQSMCSHILGRLGLIPPSTFHVLSEKGSVREYFTRVMLGRKVNLKLILIINFKLISYSERETYSLSEYNEIYL